MLGLATRLAAKALGKKATKEVDEVAKTPNYLAQIRAEKAAAEKKDQLLNNVAGYGSAGAGGAAMIGAAVDRAEDNSIKNRQQIQKEISEDAAQLKRESKRTSPGMKKGGLTASARADGIAQRGKTRGKVI